jgi:hypothetical protein
MRAMTDTTIAADTTTAPAVDLANFWLQLEIALDLTAVDDDYELLVHQMLDRYTLHMPVLDQDAARDADCRAMLRQALAICARLNCESIASLNGWFPSILSDAKGAGRHVLSSLLTADLSRA